MYPPFPAMQFHVDLVPAGVAFGAHLQQLPFKLASLGNRHGDAHGGTVGGVYPGVVGDGVDQRQRVFGVELGLQHAAVEGLAQ